MSHQHALADSVNPGAPGGTAAHTPLRTAVRAARTERLLYDSSFRPTMIPSPSSVPPQSAEPGRMRPLSRTESRVNVGELT